MTGQEPRPPAGPQSGGGWPNRVAVLRRARALSQAELSQQAGVAIAQLVRIETEQLRRQPRPRTRRKLAGALGIEPSWLERMSGDGGDAEAIRHLRWPWPPGQAGDAGSGHDRTSPDAPAAPLPPAGPEADARPAERPGPHTGQGAAAAKTAAAAGQAAARADDGTDRWLEVTEGLEREDIALLNALGADVAARPLREVTTRFLHVITEEAGDQVDAKWLYDRLRLLTTLWVVGRGRRGEVPHLLDELDQVLQDLIREELERQRQREQGQPRTGPHHRP